MGRSRLSLRQSQENVANLRRLGGRLMILSVTSDTKRRWSQPTTSTLERPDHVRQPQMLAGNRPHVDHGCLRFGGRPGSRSGCCDRSSPADTGTDSVSRVPLKRASFEVGHSGSARSANGIGLTPKRTSTTSRPCPSASTTPSRPNRLAWPSGTMAEAEKHVRHERIQERRLMTMALNDADRILDEPFRRQPRNPRRSTVATGPGLVGKRSSRTRRQLA